MIFSQLCINKFDMALIKSISGIRGTIGGNPGEGLTPQDIVRFAAAYGTWVQHRHGKQNVSVVTGRDARRSGPMVSSLVNATLTGLGIGVTDLGLASTPTVEMAVTGTGALGGIIITASHNPAEWNALKLLNEKGEFLSDDDGSAVLKIAESEKFNFVPSGQIGSLNHDNSWAQKHIDRILDLRLVDSNEIRSAQFSVAVDSINSVGSLIIPGLLSSLGVREIFEINEVPDGNFAHNPEPLPQHLSGISGLVTAKKADVGFVVDPDVDRLAIVCEDGTMFGEEYTLVAVADYILKNSPGHTVSNMSSTKALRDITEKYGHKYYPAPVGEVNVVAEMKLRNAVIGGEGNGGVIYPELHYGRDALAGIALFLSHLAKSRLKCSELRRLYPEYVIAKKKMAIQPDVDFNMILAEVRKEFSDMEIDQRDGIKIDFADGWVQIRKSNTEPVIRIYAEGRTAGEADAFADRVLDIVKNI